MSNSAMVDQKGRLKIPATLFPMLKGSGTEFFITSELQIWPGSMTLSKSSITNALTKLCT
ncbi:MAG: hypothetical protein DMG56_27360 [Acidobacteria bacterium]|nr:MAG: hypothetical protein DMG56_27360 [Acidobacteriota bacterium]